MKVLCLLIFFQYLIVQNFIISFNEEINASIQKLVHYLPQMKALQKCKNCNKYNVNMSLHYQSNKKLKWESVCLSGNVHNTQVFINETK